MNNKCLLCVVIIACFQSQVHALPSLLVDDSGFSDSDSVGDPLSASQLGESMDMPLPQELILEAKRAGIIKKIQIRITSLIVNSQAFH